MRPRPIIENADFNRGYNCGWETCEALLDGDTDMVKVAVGMACKEADIQILNQDAEIRRLRFWVMFFASAMGLSLALNVVQGVAR